MVEKIQVILVDSSDYIQEMVRETLAEHNFEVLEARTQDEVLNILFGNPKIKCVIFSGIVGGINTIGLIEEVWKSHFLGYLIAGSSDGPLADSQMKAGCHIRCSWKPYIEVLEKILNDLDWSKV